MVAVCTFSQAVRCFFLYAILRQFYAIFPWEGIEMHGLMCFGNVGKPNDYQAMSAFVEIH